MRSDRFVLCLHLDESGSHISALTEIITGRKIDTCPGDVRAGEAGYSTGQALYNKGVATMDIFSSEIACKGVILPDMNKDYQRLLIVLR